LAGSRRDLAGRPAPVERIVNDEALDILFRSARSPVAWLDRPVSDTLLRAVWELAKLGPTHADRSLTRVLFLKSAEARQRLAPALAQSDLATSTAAAVTAIVGYAANDAPNPTTALRNGSLQGAYLIMAGRALGLDCSVVSGADYRVIDSTFFADDTIRSTCLCNLGYGDGRAAPAHPPDPEFDEACRIL
jgi:3-hydroxypropanoate dehydrogenase